MIENRIRIAHFRTPREFESAYVARYFRGNGFEGSFASEPREKGGMTTAEIALNSTVFIATAHCSVRDSYCYRIGRDIAVGHLRKQIEHLGYTVTDAGIVERKNDDTTND